MSLRDRVACSLNWLGLRRPSPDGDVFIFTFSRSGLTWLTEMLDALPHTRCVREPFNLMHEEEMIRYFDPQLRYTSESSLNLDGMKVFLEDICSNRLRRLGYNPWNGEFKLKTNLNVIVMTNAPCLAGWTQSQFGARVLYLIRHPISNCLSRLRNEYAAMEVVPGREWKTFDFIDAYLDDKDYTSKYLDAGMVTLATEVRRSGSELEKYVAGWCLDHRPLLLGLEEHDWLLVPYENLVLAPEQTVENMARHLKLEAYVPRMLSRILTPSDSTHMSEAATIENIRRGDRAALLSGWRSRVSPEQSARCFDILDGFGIDIYERDIDSTSSKYDRFTVAGRPDLADKSSGNSRQQVCPRD